MSLGRKSLLFALLSLVIVSSIIVPIVVVRYTCPSCKIDNDNDDDNNSPSVSKWDKISFTLINDSVKQIKDFNNKILLLEFSSSQCIDCSDQLPILHSFWDILPKYNNNVILLSLFIDLSSQADLLDYYVLNNVTWLVGRIDSANYSSLGLSFIPSFHLFNSTGDELKSTQQILELGELWDFIDWYPPEAKLSGDDIYYYQKKRLFQNSNFSPQSLVDQSLISTSYVIDDTRSFYCLDSSVTYRSITAQVVNISSNAYFFVEQGYILALGLEIVQANIAPDVNLFEEQIFSSETSLFGNMEGSLGNIGDGKAIVLYASLPEGWAGYFDPNNEYAQSSLPEGFFSNEWEMVYLDYTDRFENSITLAHEFQHLIHFNHDSYELRWFDEGCAELSAYTSSLLSPSSNNLSYFADNYFRYSYDDSLVYWNFLGSGGRNPRIDYGGAYLFLFYLLEQLGSSALTDFVNDTSSSIASIQDYLTTLSMSFNDFFFNWQIALFLDNPSLAEGQFGFTNLDFTLEPLRTIDDETIRYFSVPYYGFSGTLIDLSEKMFDITLTNSNQKHLGITLFYYQDDVLLDFEVIETFNSSISLIPPLLATKVLVSLSFIDDSYPLQAGDGLGPSASVSLRTIDPFQLFTNANFICNSNNTHFELYGLHVLFFNETDIYYADGEDTIFLEIIGITTSEHWFLSFRPEFYGWGGYWFLSSLLPGTYNVYLNASTENYSTRKYLSSFTIELDICFSKPEMSFDNVSHTLFVSVNISVFPDSFLEQIFELSSVETFIFDSNKKLVVFLSLYSDDFFSWSAVFNCSDFAEGSYYMRVYLSYLDQNYGSPYSDVAVYSFYVLDETSFHIFFSIFNFFTLTLLYQIKCKKKINIRKIQGADSSVKI